MSSTAGKFKVRISAIAQEGSSHRAFTLAACDGVSLPPYEAGAHVDVHLADHLIRQYSLANGPAADAPYLLCIKRESNSRGGSIRLYDDTKVGDELWISAPRNLFRLEPAPAYTLVAAGIGITPILSMAHTLEQNYQHFVLHYYSRSSTDTAFLQRLQQGFTCGTVIFHHSADGDSLRQRVPPDLEQLDPAGRAYVCGPPAFIERLRNVLGSGGFPAERIHSESFAPAAANQVHASDAAFEVELLASRQIVQVPADCTIADALIQAGIAVSLSCEQGMCGACLTPVVAGEPDHRDSVQSAKELASNAFIAICCSRSKSSRLTLDL